MSSSPKSDAEMIKVIFADEAVMDVVGGRHDVAAVAVAGVETWLR